MALCCNDCFKVCEPLDGCPFAFYIYCPPTYTENDILLNITKPGVNVKVQQLLVIDLEGFIEVDLTGMPEGFLNSYAGQYSISFTNTATFQPVMFTAADGKQYSEICLSFANTISNQQDNILVLNIFTDNLPTP